MVLKRSLLIAILVLVSTAITNSSTFAQNEKNAKSTSTPAVTEAGKEGDLQARKAQKASGCNCLQPASDAVQKAYVSIEEDEWVKAIKTCKDSISAIKTLSKTCKCPEVAEYQKIVEAFSKYAEGGNHLDGAEKPNCPYALKLYDDATAILKDSIEKVSEEKVKTNAKNILEYAKEEQQFVKDECQ